MKTLICRTCGCSLVRLGITSDQAVPLEYSGEDYRFCCRACADLFVNDPEKYLQETDGLIVCPTCLGEKPVRSAAKLNIGGQEVHFCRCPYCAETFEKDPDFYTKRLEGVLPNPGVLDHDGCCVRPEL